MSLEQLIALATRLSQQPSAWAGAGGRPVPSEARSRSVGLTAQEWAGLFPECAAPAHTPAGAQPDAP